jgi:hypothetical protein
MTIISSVFVPEGIVLAADSRLTGYKKFDSMVERFVISDNAQKIMLVRDSKVGVSFCGDAIIEDKTVSDFIRLFDINYVEKSDFVIDIAKKLEKELREKYARYAISFQIAGYDNDIPYVYDVQKGKITRNNYTEEQDLVHYGAKWDGQTDPISKLFQGSSFNFDLMPLKDAIDFAEFIVESSSNYYRFIDGISTCGGAVDILVITKDYTKFYKHKIL